MAGVGVFKGLNDADFTSVDLQDADGTPMKLFLTPKTNAKTLLVHRKTYTVVRNGRPFTEPPPVEEGAEPLAQEEDPNAQDLVLPLTFEIPDDPVDPEVPVAP